MKSLDKAIEVCDKTNDDKCSIMLEKLKNIVNETNSYVDKVKKIKLDIASLDKKFNELRNELIRSGDKSCLKELGKLVDERNKIRNQI